MSTHAIGSGTCNVPINVRMEERALYGRLSFPRIQSGEFRSVGDYLRHLLLRGLELDNPAAALRLRAIRNGAMAFALLCLMCHMTWLSWQPGADDDSAMRRARGQRVRVVRSARGSGRLDLEAA